MANAQINTFRSCEDDTCVSWNYGPLSNLNTVGYLKFYFLPVTHYRYSFPLKTRWTLHVHIDCWISDTVMWGSSHLFI